jgi:DNA-binding MarR family transcriptional regulator
MKDDGAGGRLLDLADFTPYRIAVLGRAMSEQLGAAYEDEGLTIPEWRVLAVVSQAPSVAARDVVARTPMDKMAVSRAVASLEAKGLIARSPAADRRVSALELSEAGRAVFSRVSVIALDYEAALFSGLAPAERKAFYECLAKLELSVASSGSGKREARAAE